LGSILLLVFGFLLDVDHWIDYWIASGKIKFNVRELFEYSYQCKYEKIHLFLHSIELLPILFLVGFKYLGEIPAYGIAIGFITHILTDYSGNSVKPFSYFFIYRLFNRFEFSRIVDMRRLKREISKKGKG